MTRGGGSLDVVLRGSVVQRGEAEEPRVCRDRDRVVADVQL